MSSLAGSTRRWVALVLVLALMALVSGCAGAGEPTAAPAASPTTASSPLPSPQASPVADEPGFFRGVQTSVTEEGFPLLGDPDAPVTIIEFSDYQCPFCARHSTQTFPALVEQYGPTGQANFIFRDFPLASIHPNANNAATAALCTAEQSPDLFWRMHEELFSTQNDWASLPDPTGFFADMAAELGADTAAYTACITSGRSNESIQTSVAAGQSAGISSTPSFQFVNNEAGDTYLLVGAQPLETFTAWVDALLAGEAPPQEEEEAAEEPPEPQLPYWASEEGLATDPDRPGYTLAGDQYKGDPEAPLVVVEFSDFQCDACGQHAREVQPTLDEMFVDTGQVMWVFKHMPQQDDAQAAAAAAAAECAAAQGEFWGMYELLFQNAEAWAQDDPDPTLIALAEELNLDADAFAACLSSRAALEPVISDMQDGQGVVGTTPAFIVLYGGQGRIIPRSLPVEDFQTAIEQMLREATAAAE